MISWLRHHLQSLRLTGMRLLSSPVGTALNVIVIGVVLALPLGGYVALQNLQSLSGGFETLVQVSLFLERGTAGGEISSIQERLKVRPGVKEVRFVPKSVALKELARATDLADVVAALSENPLPDAFLVTLESNDPALVATFSGFAREFKQISHVQTDSDWIRRLDGLIRLGRTGVVLLALMLSGALVAVTFNTIRLQILTQRPEIEVSRLVGATDAFVQRPFLYLGGLLGHLGGMIGLLVVFGGLLFLDRDVAALAAQYGSQFRLEGISVADGVAFLFFSVVLGWLGALLSVSVHLRSMD